MNDYKLIKSKLLELLRKKFLNELAGRMAGTTTPCWAGMPPSEKTGYRAPNNKGFPREPPEQPQPAFTGMFHTSFSKLNLNSKLSERK